MADPANPKVKLTPEFAKGETVIHKDTRDELVILRVADGGALKCEKHVKVGEETRVEAVAGLIPASAVRKKTA